jgi:uncharacterized protein (DUF983 family)
MTNTDLRIYGLGECPVCGEGSLAAYKWPFSQGTKIVIECNNCSAFATGVSMARTDSAVYVQGTGRLRSADFSQKS